MDTYSWMREFADSWALLGLFGFFLGAVIWALWPSHQAARDAAAAIPFNDEGYGCDKNCATCACKTDFLNEVQNG